MKDIPSWFSTDKDFKVVCLETFLKCKMIPGTIGQMEIFFFAKKTKGCMVFKGRSTLQLRFVLKALFIQKLLNISFSSLQLRYLLSNSSTICFLYKTVFRK